MLSYVQAGIWTLYSFHNKKLPLASSNAFVIIKDHMWEMAFLEGIVYFPRKRTFIMVIKC